MRLNSNKTDKSSVEKLDNKTLMPNTQFNDNHGIYSEEMIT